MADFIGTAGDDVQDGTSGDDNFDYSQGGNDTLNGLGGADTFTLGAALNALDAIDGGSGTDTLVLDGDYDLTLTAATMVSVEILAVSAGHDYRLVLDDANIAAGGTLIVNAALLGVDDVLDFRGYAESDGRFVVNGGSGDDIVIGGLRDDALTGGDGGDTLVGGGGRDSLLGGTGTDALSGSGGDDVIDGGAESDFLSGGSGDDKLMGREGNDRLDGGTDSDILYGGLGKDTLNGMDGDVLFGGVGNDKISLQGTGDSGFAVADGGGGNDTVTIGQFDWTNVTDFNGGSGVDTLILPGVTIELASFAPVAFGFENMGQSNVLGTGIDNTFDFSGMTATATTGNRPLSVHGGRGNDALLGSSGVNWLWGDAGNDVLTGGAGESLLRGGDGDDTLIGGSGIDTFQGDAGIDLIVVGAVANSTSLGYDNLRFDAAAETVDLDTAVAAFDARVNAGRLTKEAFDSEMQDAIGAAQLGAGHAVIFDPNQGNLSGVSFLIVDGNGTAGYQAGEDYVFRINEVTNQASLDASDFV
jgi:Ca2+-binding RTX toxin-like protein